MRWQMGRRSSNVEDRRGRSVGVPVVGGGIGMIILAVIIALLGGDPSIVLDQASQVTTSAPPSAQIDSPEQQELVEFVSVVLADTEDTWSQIFRKMGGNYQEPTLVLFTGTVQSGCGYAQAAMGPFYCPLDQKLYIDLSFYDDLKNRHGAPGDFAQAYVIAHEVGHHVQNLLGISDQVQRMQQRSSKVQANELSVRLELQADCLAGVWAAYTQQSDNVSLEPGDIEEALNAAASIGDDRLQKQAQGYAVPDSFTHGTSAQRVRWFTQGVKTGDPNQCNTFDARNL
ncbi:MAG: neutral zinc metallopeptidase [Synechococcales cyanobacterium T60_A2020_003]|nr:neutral zinc metallopeptidase [Synechococcales cyanobacterium T60_A2020_003]